jgi:hypothetical protein
MSSQLDSLFDGLRAQHPPAPFAPADAVRRRGRQRAHRQAVSAGVAVLAVTGLGAGGLAVAVGQPDPATPPATTGTPPPSTVQTPAVPTRSSEIPPAWLLTASDLGPDGTGWEETGNELLEGAWYWDGEPWCPEYRLDDYPSVPRRLDVATVSWQATGAALPERVDQLVELFDAGGGAANLDDVRAFVETCSRRPAEGDQVAPTYFEIEQTGFAGDESLLIRAEAYQFNADDQIEPAGEFEYTAVVRVGDAVTTIVYRAGGDAREVARRAADRLG